MNIDDKLDKAIGKIFIKYSSEELQKQADYMFEMARFFERIAFAKSIKEKKYGRHYHG